MGKSGIVRWLSKGGDYLWFQYESSNIPVPIKTIQQIPNLQTLQFMQDRGYNVKAGDVVKVACGPEYSTKGVMQSIDFPNARLTLLAETDHSLVDIPIGFIIKVSDASLDSFKKDIGQEVYIIGGDHKGYRATLYSLSSMDCTVALHGQQHTKIQLKNIATRHGMRLNGAMLKEPNMLSFCEMQRRLYLAPQPQSVTPPPEKVALSSSVSITNPPVSQFTWTTWSASSEDLDTAGNPASTLNNTAQLDPWAVNMLEAETEILKESPLAWLMNKEFCSKFTTHHVVLKVSPSFMGGRLHN
ncbi:hypothetical protein BDR04DRAFT_1149502 [Suillus decipiens]|nr:hypothetical protein BDR04DRAFT_1149502 [Suillus decipiens]